MKRNILSENNIRLKEHHVAGFRIQRKKLCPRFSLSFFYEFFCWINFFGPFLKNSFFVGILEQTKRFFPYIHEIFPGFLILCMTWKIPAWNRLRFKKFSTLEKFFQFDTCSQKKTFLFLCMSQESNWRQTSKLLSETFIFNDSQYSNSVRYESKRKLCSLDFRHILSG